MILTLLTRQLLLQLYREDTDTDDLKNLVAGEDQEYEAFLALGGLNST